MYHIIILWHSLQNHIKRFEIGVVMVKKKKDSQTYSKAPLRLWWIQRPKTYYRKITPIHSALYRLGVVAYGYSHDKVRIRKDLKENSDKVSVLE